MMDDGSILLYDGSNNYYATCMMMENPSPAACIIIMLPISNTDEVDIQFSIKDMPSPRVELNIE